MAVLSKAKVIKQFDDTVLSIVHKKNENEIQSFLTENADLIPLTFLLNHGLHFDFIFSKLPVSESLTSDFAYMTKSSVEWVMVFIELEDSNKKIFTNNTKNINFSAEFNNAYDQLLSWRAYLQNNKTEFKNKFKDLMFHMFNNTLNFQFLLVIGRSSELTTNERKNMFAEKNKDGIRVITYDSLKRMYLTNKRDFRNIATKVKNGFRIIKFDEKSYTGMFSYLNKDNLFFDKAIETQLINDGYDIPSWKKGEQLSLNNKQVFKGSFNKSKKDDFITKELKT